MAQSDALKKYLDAGMAFTALTRARAEQVVKELVAAGELQRNQTKSAIDDLVERSKKNAETLSEQVRKEVDSQLSSLGLARKADVEKLEAELAKLKGDAGTKPEKKAPEKKAPEKKAPAKKAPAKPEDSGKGPEAKGEQGPVEQADKPAEKTQKAAKAARKSGGLDSAGAAGALPARQAAESDDKAAPAKKAKAANARKKESQLSSAKNGDDQAGVSAGMPAKKPTKKTTKKQS